MKKQYVLFLVLLLGALFGSSASAAGLPDIVSLYRWALDHVVEASPPGKSQYPEAKETEDDGRARYDAIVRDAVAVAYDPSEAPIFPATDPIARAKTLAVMLGIMEAESGFRKDVDKGRGMDSKGDNGESWCLMQIRLSTIGRDGKTGVRIGLKGDGFEYVYDKSLGYGGEDMVEDRRVCIRVGLHMARVSFRNCRALPVDERLSAYASGNCEDGKAKSRYRMGLAIRWLAKKAPPMDDLSVMAALSLASNGLRVTLLP